MEIKELLAHSGNYTSKNTRSLSNIKYIVIHYTGNKGDKAISNCKFFQEDGRKASAHYFVDEKEIYRSVPDNYVAWSVGSNKYSNCAVTGGGTYYGKCTNNNSISVEMCNSVNEVPSAIKDKVKELVVELMKKYNVPKENVIRHFDVVGKECPLPFADKSKNAKWLEFRDYITTVNNSPIDDKELSQAVSVIIKSGINIDFNSWKRTDLFVLKNVPFLLDKLGGLDKLIANGIISDAKMWKEKTYKETHVRSLIIKFASKIR